jgi:nitroimidazol reductase NimA-like FMN-containing flavoprotein (pyridoxamine 5'-phosphate oxidase superfamily)
VINAILDEGLYCHVGFVLDGQPYVQPTVHARLDEELFVHGAASNRMFGVLRGGAPVCITVTLLDGLVLARAAFKHSMNYRSVMILGQAREVSDEAGKRRAMAVLVDRVLPGRAAAVRAPSSAEVAASIVLSVPISEASAKVRTGPPIDAEADFAQPCWAGVLPLQLAALTPLPDPHLPPGTPVPSSLSNWRRGGPG